MFQSLFCWKVCLNDGIITLRNTASSFQSLFCWKVCLNCEHLAWMLMAYLVSILVLLESVPEYAERMWYSVGNELSFNPCSAGKCAWIQKKPIIVRFLPCFNPCSAGKCAWICGCRSGWQRWSAFQSLFCWKVCLNLNITVSICCKFIVSILVLLESVPEF